MGNDDIVEAGLVKGFVMACICGIASTEALKRRTSGSVRYTRYTNLGKLLPCLEVSVYILSNMFFFVAL